MKQPKRKSRQGAEKRSHADSKNIRTAFIINMFREFPDRQFSLKQLTSASGGNSKEGRYIVRDVVEALVAEGVVDCFGRDKYQLSTSQLPHYEGVVDMIGSGAAYVKVEELESNYAEQLARIREERREILGKAKEEAQRLVAEANRQIENTIRTIKEAQAEKEKTRLARQELSDFKGQIDDINKQNEEDKIAQKMQKLREKQERKKDKKNQPQAAANAPKPIEPKVKPIEKGSIVKIKGQTGVGQVLDISGKTAIVSFGMIKTNVKIDRLEVTDAPIQKANAVSSFVSSKTQDHVYEKKLEFKQDIDVRGMRGDEAIQAVTYFIDDAILLGISRVRILHGTGNGILRTLIRNYLSGVPGVAHFQDEHVQFGGAGITVVDLD
mgnify:CR=1 FL=1